MSAGSVGSVGSVENAAPQRARAGGRKPAAVWCTLAVAAYVAAAIAGVQTVRQAHEMRGLYRQLSATQEDKSELLVRYQHLLLERATFAGYQNIERTAEEQLGMRFPEQVVQVVQVAQSAHPAQAVQVAQ